MVRQIGPPTFFFTISPFEWSFPYHEWVRNEMAVMLRSRTQLPLAETLHMAHTLTEVIRGMIAGNPKPGSGTDNHHEFVFASKDGSNRKVVLQFFMRLEFQDGTRKKATQKYHGSGRVHGHALFWCQNLEAANLEKHVSASMPREEPMKSYVAGSQFDHDHKSAWPVFSDASHFDVQTQTLRLQHFHQDSENGLRAYLVDVMDVLKCHQDLQMLDPYCLWQQYCTKYCAKFSNSSYDEWCAEPLDGNSVAARFCCQYHPLEPEMILQLAGQLVRQWDISTIQHGVRSVQVPWPDKTPLRPFVEQYLESSWRDESTTLLEFLRKTNDKGELMPWLKKACKNMAPDDTNACYRDFQVRGEKVVSAHVWILNLPIYR